MCKRKKNVEEFAAGSGTHEDYYLGRPKLPYLDEKGAVQQYEPDSVLS